jgi:hypothetical protein
MGTELRLGFAMGGGVSLGTFCGAALSETIKLLLLYGRDAKGKPYDRVKVDVFSGASAGAMSLGLMLRTLADPDPAREPLAVRNLTRLYGEDFTKLDPDGSPYKDLVAAQVLQDVQWEVWVQQIDIRSLLGKDMRHPPTDFGCEPSIFDSEAINRLARQMINRPESTPFDRRRILADRALYACTLSNLCPIMADARREISGPEVGFVGLTDGMRSSVRRELRVFDLNFLLKGKEQATTRTPALTELIGKGTLPDVETGYPARWCRYHESGETAGTMGDLKDPRTWKKLGATAVASGAFPMAFRPVVLSRRRYEFGKLWPKVLADHGITDEYPFSYIDGGTFNNEPIREAFRLAAYLDAQAADTDVFDRRIVFVDPSVSDEHLPLRVSIHATDGLQASAKSVPFGGADPVRFTTLDRLIPHAGALLSALSDESSTIEADKIFQTRNRSDLRHKMRRGFLTTGLTSSPTKQSLQDLKAFCETLLATNRLEAMIPPGALTLAEELERVAREIEGLAGLRKKAGAFCKLKDPSTDPQVALWFQALVAVAIDLTLDLEGETGDPRLIAIAPFVGMLEYAERARKFAADQDASDAARAAGVDGKEPVRPEGPPKVTLYGGEVQGFAGFMSETVRAHDFNAGVKCAGEFLCACKMIPALPTTDLPLPKLDWTVRPLADELKTGIDGLADRVGDMLARSHVLNLGWGLDGPALALLGGVIRGIVTGLAKLGRPSQSFELRVRVTGEDYSLDGAGIGHDVKPKKFGDGWYLVTFAKYYPGTNGAAGLWEGPHVAASPNGQSVEIDHDELWGAIDKFAFSIRTPDDEVRERANVYPNPALVCDAQSIAPGSREFVCNWDIQPGCTPLEDSL